MKKKIPNYSAMIVTLIIYGIIAYFAYNQKDVVIRNGEELVSAIFSLKGALLLFLPLVTSGVLAIINNDTFFIGSTVATIVACIFFIANEEITFVGTGYLVYTGGSFLFSELSNLFPGEPPQPKTFEEEQSEFWRDII